MTESWKVASWLLLVLGAWVVLAPFMLVNWSEAFYSGLAYYPAAVYWNNVLAGLALSGLAAARLFQHRGVWAAWAEIAVGAWLLFSPWVLLTYTENTITTNNMVAGLAAIGLGIWMGVSRTAARPATFQSAEPEDRDRD